MRAPIEGMILSAATDIPKGFYLAVWQLGPKMAATSIHFSLEDARDLVRAYQQRTDRPGGPLPVHIFKCSGGELIAEYQGGGAGEA